MFAQAPRLEGGRGVPASPPRGDHGPHMSTVPCPHSTAPLLRPPGQAALPDLDGHPPRVVLDNAVVLSALVFGGPTATRLRRAWRNGFCRPMVCRDTLLDLTRQLGQARLASSVAEQQQMLGEYLPYVLRVRVPPAARPGQVEPASLAFVKLGMVGKAHVLVTSDPSLLAMRARLPFEVMAQEPFLNLLRASAIAPAPLRHPARRTP
jgi:predicted nucleic acid-binding protein